MSTTAEKCQRETSFSTLIYRELAPIDIPIVSGATLTPYIFPKDATFTRHIYSEPEHIPARDDKYIASLVLDLDETLINARTGVYYIRPYTREFLESVYNKHPEVEIIVWSAGSQRHVDRILQLIDPNYKLVNFTIARCKDSKWYKEPIIINGIDTGEYGAKNLSKLPGRGKTSMLVDDLELHTLVNPDSVIIVQKFTPSHPCAAQDTTLIYVLQVVSRMMRLYAISLQEERVISKSDRLIYPANKLSDFIHDHPFITKTPHILPAHLITEFTRVKYMFYRLNVANCSMTKERITIFRESYQARYQRPLETYSAAPAMEHDQLPEKTANTIPETRVVDDSPVSPGLLISSTINRM